MKVTSLYYIHFVWFYNDKRNDIAYLYGEIFLVIFIWAS